MSRGLCLQLLLISIALAVTLEADAQPANATTGGSSLRGKSNEELFELMIGRGRAEEYVREQTKRTAGITWPERLRGFWFSIVNLLDQQGLWLGQPTSFSRQPVYPNENVKLIRTHGAPKSSAPEDLGPWMDRMLAILQALAQHVTDHLEVLFAIVPWYEPLRYRDPRIDVVLLEMLSTYPTAPAPEGHEAFEADDYARRNSRLAAEVLTWRDRPDAFPILLRILEQQDEHESAWEKIGILDAAVGLAWRHEELRPALVEYLRSKLQAISDSSHDHDPQWFFDATWRGNFRELEPELAKLATVSADEIQDTRAVRWNKDLPLTTTNRFHDPRKILIAWNEPDALTKLKLDAFVESSSRHNFRPAPLLRAQFEKLPPPEQSAFLDFVRWLALQRVWSNWSTQMLEDEFGVKLVPRS